MSDDKHVWIIFLHPAGFDFVRGRSIASDIVEGCYTSPEAFIETLESYNEILRPNYAQFLARTKGAVYTGLKMPLIGNFADPPLTNDER